MDNKTLDVLDFKAIKKMTKCMSLLVFMFIVFSCVYTAILLNSGKGLVDKELLINEHTLKKFFGNESIINAQNGLKFIDDNGKESDIKEIAGNVFFVKELKGNDLVVKKLNGNKILFRKLDCKITILICSLAALPLIFFILFLIIFPCRMKNFNNKKILLKKQKNEKINEMCSSLGKMADTNSKIAETVDSLQKIIKEVFEQA